MLSIILSDKEEVPLDYDGYCIVQNANGWEDKLKFTLPLNHPQAYLLTERTRIWENSQNQVYAISSISNGKTDTAYEAELDLDDLQGKLLTNWNNYVATGLFSKGPQSMADTLSRAIDGVSSWQINPKLETKKFAIESFDGTPLELIKKIVEVWQDYTVRFRVPKTGTKTIAMYHPSGFAGVVTGTFLSDELNLRERPTFKGKAVSGDGYYTALRLYGKDGIYVDAKNTDYDSRTIWHTESDTSISDKKALRIKADKMIKSAASPSRSYTCNVMDLYAHDSEKYRHLEISLYRSITLIDRYSLYSTLLQVVQKTIYPYYPEKNQVQLNTVAGTISKKAQKYSGDVVEYTEQKAAQAEEEAKETVYADT